MSRLETFRLAIEALLANKMRAALTMLGMVIGVAAVVLLVSLGQGAKKYVQKEFEGMGTNLIIVQPGKMEVRGGFAPPNMSSRRPLSTGDVAALERESFNLEAITGEVNGVGSVKVDGRTSQTQIWGGNEQWALVHNMKVERGQFYTREEDKNGRRVTVLGYGLAKRVFGSRNPIGQFVRVNESEHRVVGVMAQAGETMGINMDDLAVIPTQSALRIFNLNRLSDIVGKAKSKVSIDDATADMKRILKARHNGEEDFTVITQEKMLGTMGTVMNMFTYVLGAIAMISMLVGGIGIMNIMLVSVTERTREIGIRRAVGARQIDILSQFLTEALLLSTAGGVIGLIISLFLGYLVTFLSGGFDMVASWWVSFPAFLLSLVVGVAFGVWPARKASRLETIDALRYE